MYTCICGTVYEAHEDPAGGYFYFTIDPDPSSLLAISNRFTWSDLPGRCVRICGTIQTYADGTPYMVLNHNILPPCP